MRYDPERPVAYGENGRLLTDDVGDSTSIFTNGKVTEDGVAHTDDLLPASCYLGPPHENRTVD